MADAPKKPDIPSPSDAAAAAGAEKSAPASKKSRGPRLDFSDPYTLKGNRVLVVDDDPLIGKVISAGLRKQRYTVEIAATGYEAGFLTVDFEPDVVLLDLNLPDIDGDIVCKRIRESENTRHLKVIGISATADEQRIKDMHAAGINQFIPKPFQIEELRQAIVKQVGPMRRRPPEPLPAWKTWVALTVLCQVVLAAAYGVAMFKTFRSVDPRRATYMDGRWVTPQEAARARDAKKRRRWGYVPDPLREDAWIPFGRYEAGLRAGRYDHLRDPQVLEDRRRTAEGMRLVGAGKWINGREFYRRRLRTDPTEAARARSVRNSGGFMLNGEERNWLDEERRHAGRRFFADRWFDPEQLQSFAEVRDRETGRVLRGFVSDLGGGRLRIINAKGGAIISRDKAEISPRKTPWTEYWKRADKLTISPGRKDAHLSLARWCRDKRLLTAMRRHARIALIIDRNNKEARRLLGKRRDAGGAGATGRNR